MNLKGIEQKITGAGFKVIKEKVDSPLGEKTRVRVGPFSSKEAAEKALEKMRPAGISGTVSGK